MITDTPPWTPPHRFEVMRSTADEQPAFTLTIIGGNQALFDKLVQELTRKMIDWDYDNNSLKKL